MGEVIFPSSPSGRALRLVFEVVGVLVFLASVIFIVPHAFAAIILLCLGVLIVIRRKTYSDFGLIQSRGSVLIGSTFFLVGSVMAVIAILKV
jgi:hypothetical protein